MPLPSLFRQFSTSRRPVTAWGIALGAVLIAAPTALPAAAQPTAQSGSQSGVAAGAPTADSASSERRSTAAQIAAASPGDFTGYAFDQCQAPSQAAMDKWRKHSPFSAVGIYVSGDSRACRTQTHLDATWVANQVAKGWRLLPIVLGPQASCQPRFPRYDDDVRINSSPRDFYAAALAQGVAEAGKSAADATALGLGPGSTIWYDLEAFDMKNTHCRESAMRFVSGWSSEMKARGFVAGLYSSASSGIVMVENARTQQPQVHTLPDRIWIARWDGQANTSTTYIPDSGWLPGGRVKQYLGDHTERWGNVSINIDSNWMDIGRGSRGIPESGCSAKLGFWKYPTLSPTKAPANRVKALQCLLAQQGHYTGPADGAFNVATQVAAREWQAARGFVPTTTFEKRHWVALLSAGAATPTKRGSVGEHVHRVQRALNAAGAGQFRANGTFNAKTEAAVRAYQKRRGMLVSGVVNPQTWNALRSGKH